MSSSRRALLRTGGSALALALAGCSDALSTGTPTETVTPAPLPSRQGNWQTDVGESVRARPVVTDGTVFVAADAGDGVELVALDPTDGAERGRHHVPGQLRGSPVAVAGGVAVATVRERRGVSGTVTLLAADGTVRWQTPPARGRPTPLGATDGTVHVGWRGIEQFDGTVVARADGTETDTSTPEPTPTPVERTERGVVAYATDDGRVRWRAAPGDVTDGVVAGGHLFAVNDYPPRLDVYALAATGDRHRWNRETRTVPAVAGATAYFPGPELLAVDVTTGRERWEVREGGVRNIAADGRGAYVGRDDALSAHDAADGNERWTVSLGNVSSSPAIAGGAVYAVGNGVVAAVDAADGAVGWRTDLGAGSATPTVTSGTVYVRFGRWLHAVDRADGTHRWTFTPGEGVSLTPLVAGSDDRVFVADSEGTVSAFGGESA